MEALAYVRRDMTLFSSPYVTTGDLDIADQVEAHDLTAVKVSDRLAILINEVRGWC